jgi:GNAT superfamily N-acetyltransferase
MTMHTIHQDHLGYHHQQHDFVLCCLEDGLCIGSLEFVEYEGSPSIQMIEVSPGHRKRGVAAAMMRDLQERYPGIQIDLGTVVGDGGAFFAKLRFNTAETPGYAERKDEIAELGTRLLEYAEAALAFTRAGKEEERAALVERLSNWNDLLDRKDELERELSEMAPTISIVAIDSEEFNLKPRHLESSFRI